jgi:hypothetical protein
MQEGAEWLRRAPKSTNLALYGIIERFVKSIKEMGLAKR